MTNVQHTSGPTGPDVAAAPPAASASLGVLVLQGGSVAFADATVTSLLGPATDEIADVFRPLGVDPGRSRGGELEAVEFQLVSVPQRWLEAIRLPTGPTGSELVIIRDVTAARRSRGLHEMVARLLMHEIRTPMTGILAAAELVHSPTARPGTPAGDALMEIIAVDAERLRRLIDDLDIVTELGDAGDRGSLDEPLRVERMLPAIVERERRRHPLVDVSLSMAPTPPIAAEPAAFEHIMHNIIDDTARRGIAAATVVTAGPADEGGVEITVCCEGYDAEEREQDLLGPFGYVPLGLGHCDSADIGLHATDRLVDSLGGRMWSRRWGPTGRELGIWFESAEDDGV